MTLSELPKTPAGLDPDADLFIEHGNRALSKETAYAQFTDECGSEHLALLREVTGPVEDQGTAGLAAQNAKKT